VRGHELAVEQARAPAPERCNQPGERHFGGIGHSAEHRFAAEHPVESDPVEAPDEVLTLPTLDRVGMTQPVEFAIARRDPAADPGFGSVGRSFGAGRDDRVEGGVAGHRESPPPQRARQRTRGMEPIERQDRASARLDPKHLGIVAVVGHREHARPIGEQQQFGIYRLGNGGMHRAGDNAPCAHPCHPAPQ